MKNHILVILLLSSPLPGAILADVSSTGEEETRYYDVEVVIFKNNKVPKDREFVLPVSSPIKDEEIFDLSSADSIAAAKEKSFEVIPQDELRLTESVLKIVESPRYSLLVHTGWRQPGLEKDQAIPVWIKGGRIFGNEYTSIDDGIGSQVSADSDSALLSSGSASSSAAPGNPAGLYELEGKITIVLARYLHTFANLVLRKPRLTVDTEVEFGDQNQLSEEQLPDTRILNNHPLKEQRRMRSNRLHYLDSPEFAMLILITPYEVPETDAEAANLTVEEAAGVNNNNTGQ